MYFKVKLSQLFYMTFEHWYTAFRDTTFYYIFHLRSLEITILTETACSDHPPPDQLDWTTFWGEPTAVSSVLRLQDELISSVSFP